MTAYAYRAVHNKRGGVQKGTLDAANENELAHLLRELDLELIEAKKQRELPSFRKLWLPKPSTNDLANFCGQISDLIVAGIPFTQALELVTNAQTSPPLRDTLIMIGNDIRAGCKVAKAFENQSIIFDPIFLSLLTAGENSGDLGATFARLAEHLKWEASINREINRALRYPFFLLLVACGVTSFMMLFVVPQIISFLTNLEQELPFSTRFLISAAQLFEKLWWSAPLIVALAYLIIKHVRKSGNFAIYLDRFALALPVIGTVARKLAIARLTSSFTVLLKNGLSVPVSLKLASTTLGNAEIERTAALSYQRLVDGLPLSKATHTLFTPMMIQIIHIAEQSSTLPKALDEIAQNSTREAHQAVESFLGLLEPVLTLLVGGLLAWIVLAVLGPIYGSLTPLARGM